MHFAQFIIDVFVSSCVCFFHSLDVKFVIDFHILRLKVWIWDMGKTNKQKTIKSTSERKI